MNLLDLFNRDDMHVPVEPQNVLDEISKHVLVDGFKIVVDLNKSKGNILVDESNGRSYIDCYSFFASMPIGYNHPYFNNSLIEKELLTAAKTKVANSDVYSVYYATFVKTFYEVMGLAPLDRLFFIAGGALAVENALKAAMDWKVRKNIAAGKGEIGTEIIHFKHAFHGRSGYTMSLTNTDPNKVMYFAKFDWPRISLPNINFTLRHKERLEDVIHKENQAEKEIMEVLAKKKDHIAAIIIEPIQGEGGDNHFRKEWMQKLRKICDENEILLIFDEVQCGMGATGRRWACEHFDVIPDMLVFGKKAQVCGVMAGPRLDEVKDNVFRVSGRINSTWGGDFCDFVRSTHYLRIIKEEKLIQNAEYFGHAFQQMLLKLCHHYPFISGVRGRGTYNALDLPNKELRNKFREGCFEKGLLCLNASERSIRFRCVLDTPVSLVSDIEKILHAQCEEMKNDL